MIFKLDTVHFILLVYILMAASVNVLDSAWGNSRIFVTPELALTYGYLG